MEYAFEGAQLAFGGKKFSPSVRTFSQMREVLAFPERDCGLLPDAPLYYMYRQVKRFSSLRYDITRILPVNLCGERNKTFGHAHPPSKDGAAWSELYEVLSGSCHFLLQKVSQLGVEDAVLLSAKKGDCFIVPPGYGHVTINAGRKELVMANLVCDGFEADYSLFSHRRGACFYELYSGKIVKNKNYGTGFFLRRMDAARFSRRYGVFAALEGKSILEAAKNFSDIEFLEKPHLFY
ncbi:MAG: hypothetical protein N3E51_00965 [Candidatus Micrarchaeota archaeon]|nr:hypothetical protein [Candidatus Micrarchaeota archaeon]